MNLNGKVVIVTGASGGLGSAVTEAFLQAGARVAGVARSIKQADSAGDRFLAFAAELSNIEQARAVASSVLAKWGRVDVLVHLVGGFEGGHSIAESDDAALDRMIGINVKPAYSMLRAVLPVMREQGSGALLAIGARTAVEPVAGLGVYSASKAALVSLIRTVALENKDRGISANAILPGTMDTPANRAAMPGADPSKWVQPSQVAALLVHLASNEASQISGAVIPIYGADA